MKEKACQACRQRKSKCTLNYKADECLSCQIHGTNCIFRNSDPRRTDSVAQPSTTTSNPSKRKRSLPRNNSSTPAGTEPHIPSQVVIDHILSEIDPPHHEPQPPALNEMPIGNLAEGLTGGDDDAHVVVPITAFDSDVLEKYLSSLSATFTPSSRMALAVAGEGEQLLTPIMFDTVPKRPLGAGDRQSLAAIKCEVVEKLVGSSTQQVVDLYFDCINKNFPLFDQGIFSKLFRDYKSSISPALLCNLYACALAYWKQSADLSSYRCPDIRFSWLQAGEALYSEMFLAPGMSTIIAILLNVNGRPCTSTLGNCGLIGFATSLANSLGLNRDPRSWKIPISEQHLRIRIWWQVVLLDKWFSLSYGVPSHTRWPQFDVPYPTLEVLNISDTSSWHDCVAADIYIALLTLTEVLNQYLDFVYRLQTTHAHVALRSSEDLESILGQWEESLTDEVREIIIHKRNLNLSGAANFRLAYMGIRLFLCKIQLEICVKSQPSSGETPSSRHFMRCQRAAEDIVHFTKYLSDEELCGFWSPTSAFSLTSATTFLLRNALRLTHPERNTPLKMVVEMMSILRKHQKDHGWDLPDHCLKRWAVVVEKISSLDVPDLEVSDPFQDDLDVNQWAIDELFPDTWGMLLQ